MPATVGRRTPPETSVGRNFCLPPGEDRDPPAGRLGERGRAVPSSHARHSAAAAPPRRGGCMASYSRSRSMRCRTEIGDATRWTAPSASSTAGDRPRGGHGAAARGAARRADPGIRSGDDRDRSAVRARLRLPAARRSRSRSTPSRAGQTRHRVRTAVLAASVAVLLGPSLVRYGLGPEVFSGAARLGGRVVRRRPCQAAARAIRRRGGARTTGGARSRARAPSRRRGGADAHRPRPARLRGPRGQRHPRPGRCRPAPPRAGPGPVACSDRDDRRRRSRHARRDRPARPRAAGDGPPDGVEPPAGLAALDTLARALARRRASTSPSRSRAPASRCPRTSTRLPSGSCGRRSRTPRGTAPAEPRSSSRSSLPRSRSRSGIPCHRLDNANGGGHGLVGMRERAVLLGGTLEATAADGVFRVRASLPYREPS